MDSASYDKLFRKLEFHDVTRRKTLKHPKLSCTVYFNSSLEGLVYFTVYTKDHARFNSRLWEFIGPQQKKDDQPKFRTVVPKRGLEAEAFRDLLA